MNASMYAVDAEAAPRSSPTPRILRAGNKYKNDMDHRFSMIRRNTARHALWQRADFSAQRIRGTKMKKAARGLL
ncbi:hypothetical protein [Duganella qianjiadongensis]|uniref:Transposase n=1 Tax=Duganella qianjiadongensis TaxID=2692176 RepID=A0ABW9VIR4_9BURK|nr:hypothetical protein [Duganella qianjiadongensis]MYM39395.1 hypothetical protein [Duganella qianjiadongensis]